MTARLSIYVLSRMVSQSPGREARLYSGNLTASKPRPPSLSPTFAATSGNQQESAAERVRTG